jgi:small-conductance mechanosensitive channel
MDRAEPRAASASTSRFDDEEHTCRPMKSLRTVVAVALLLALAAAVYGWLTTMPASTPAGARPTSPASASQPGSLVDQTPLNAAKRLLPLATTAEEQRLAESAVTAADQLLDLAFAAALRDVTEHPVALTPAAQAVQTRLDRVAERLVIDNTEVVRLTEILAKAKGERNAALEGELALARAQFEVDQDEFNQASADLIDAGGDLRGRIQALVAEHAAAAQPKPAPRPVAAGPGRGLIHLLETWSALRDKQQALVAAQTQTTDAVAALATERASLMTRIETRTRDASAPVGSAAPHAEPRAPEVSATLLANTQKTASDQKTLANVGERSAAQQKLATLYGAWRAIVTEQTTEVLHRILLAIAVIVGVCLLLLFFDGWLRVAFARLRIDRRQVETLRTVTGVTLQIAAVLFIVLVIIGPPSQLATFLGLAGAGLTVALKDFIVAFVGWLVLMGKNGIRLGDWVEINGVAGEVVELGMFHTVLLETGNWTDSGHPTGRRVTFTNSFAIEGHYFNFSTTGQWLWDELQVVVPAGQDLYAVVDSISRTVKDATADNARQAEDEWRRAAPSRKLGALTAAPAINVRPVVGGTEISLRYIARANERYQLRGKLYQAAVDLLGQKHRPPAVAAGNDTR